MGGGGGGGEKKKKDEEEDLIPTSPGCAPDDPRFTNGHL